MKKSSIKKKRGGDPTVLTIIDKTPEYMKELDKYYSHKLKRLHQEEIKEINLNEFKDKIPEKIKNAIITAFENYKLTNNGVIFCDSNKSCKKGGASLNQLSDPNLIAQLQTYCQTVINDNDDIQKFIDNILARPSTLSTMGHLNDLKTFINNNKIQRRNEISILYNPRYEYQNVRTIIDNDVENKHSKQYMYHDYNKEIVLAYEKNFFDSRNITAIQNFIAKQKTYLEGLTIREKKIIQDYTKPESFDYYKYYKNIAESDRSIPEWRTNNFFGDSFYHQIHDLKDNAGFTARLSDDQIATMNSPNRGPANDQTEIVLNDNQWQMVLEKFMKDLNEIILKAPPVEEVIHCYRGVSAQYTTGGPLQEQNLLELIQVKPKVRSFVSNRLGSFSVDFNISKKFYDDLIITNPLFERTRCLYRTAIMPGCRILYVAPLSLVAHEVEFISPVDSKFLYNIDQSTHIELSPTLSNNNINREFGICSREDEQFRSFDIVLAFTPQPQDAFTVISNVLGDIGNEAINNYLDVCSCCQFS
jgi:hypothetical protein